jgi:hypothetical protein
MSQAAEGEIIGGIVSGIGRKIFIEMSLIVIATAVGYSRPINRLYGINGMKNILESYETGKLFRGDTDQPFEVSGQVILTDPNLFTKGVN